MIEQIPHELALRLDRLEFWHTLLFLLIPAIAAAEFLFLFVLSRRVVTQTIVLRDARGMARIRLASDDDATSLFAWDTKQRLKFLVGVRDEEVTLGFLTQNSDWLMAFTLAEGAYLVANSGSDRRSVLLGTNDAKEPGLRLAYGRDEGNQGLVIALAEDSPLIGLEDRFGTARSYLWLDQDAGPTLQHCDREGKRTAHLFINDGREHGLMLSDKSEHVRVWIGFNADAQPVCGVCNAPEEPAPGKPAGHSTNASSESSQDPKTE